MDAVERSFATIDRQWDDEVAFLRELVRRPSVRGGTNPVQDLVDGVLRGEGLDVHRVGLDVDRLAGRRGFSPVDWSYDGLTDVVGVASGAGGGRSLVLNGHVDVVSAEPVAHWQHDPWAGDIDGGRMYGRGAADMKSGIAAMIYALKAVRDSGVRLRGDVVVQTVIDEECSGNGTLACLDAGWTADAAIIPEPMDLALVTAHPGVLWCQLRVRGRGAHARAADEAVNPADKAFALVAALRELEAEWNAPDHVHPSLRSLAHPINFNLGTIHCGDWASTAPELCTVELRLACHPGDDLAQVKRTVEARLRAAADVDDWLREVPPDVAFVGFHADGCVYDLDTPIAGALAASHRRVTGAELASRPSAATIDNRLFELSFGIPNLCYGATGGQLHAPDEWVDLDSVRTVTKVLAATLVEWCGAV